MSFIPALINNKEINLYKYAGEGLEIDKGHSLEPLSKESNIIRICCLDLETTGLDNKSDEVIEIAMKLFEVDKLDATEIKAVKAYESYNEPRKPISDEITQLTGITPEMVKGQSIDWKEVSRLLGVSQIVVAHNAAFDRGFLEQYIKTSNIWACSSKDVDWKARGFFNQKLDKQVLKYFKLKPRKNLSPGPKSRLVAIYLNITLVFERPDLASFL